jgi:hypothetical protein
MVAMLTRTPGPQVGLYKAHSGIKWWSSEKLQPRIPPCVNVPFDFWGCQSGCTKWWLYEVILETSVARFPPMYGCQSGCTKWWVYQVSGGCVEVSPNVRKSAELRAMEISKVKEERKADV